MKLFLNILIICFVFLQSVTSISQNVTASVESDSTLIGKELIYTIDVSSERVENIIFPDSTSFVPFELISEYQIDTTEVEEGFLFSKKYGITSFDEGEYIIPKIKIQIGDKLFSTRGVTSFGYANNPLILIDGLEVTTNDLARIEPRFINNTKNIQIQRM